MEERIAPRFTGYARAEASPSMASPLFQRLQGEFIHFMFLSGTLVGQDC